jgi:hypothetical protein
LTFLDTLFNPYSFSELVNLIINKLGLSSLIVLLGAYFAAIVYFCALPTKSRFSADTPRSNAVTFAQQAFYIFSLLTFLMPFISGWSSFFLVLLFYSIIAVPMLTNIRLLAQDFTFDEYLKFRRGGLVSAKWKLCSLGLTWISILGEFLAFSYFDPTIPLLGWAILTYSIAAAVLQAALGQSYLIHIYTCLYAEIGTVDGPVEGFILAKGSDHYIVKTKENDVLLPSERIKSISQTPLPEQKDG